MTGRSQDPAKTDPITGLTGRDGFFLAERPLARGSPPKTAFEDTIAAMVAAHRARLAAGH